MTLRRLGAAGRPVSEDGRQLLDILECLVCRGRLMWGDGDLTCCACGGHFPLVDGVPVLTPLPHAVEVRRHDHIGHQLPAGLVEDLARLEGLWLHLGAGATERAIPNCVEVEYHIFRNTTLVADAARLPFVDGSFLAAVGFNTFEHLPEPVVAAAELHRVLAPGAQLIIQTAFLQPVHADPSRYYNATEAGVRHWFRQFEIEACEVPPNFNPVFSIAWLASDLLLLAGGLGERAVRLLEQALAEWSTFWREPARRAGPLWDLMQRLPMEAQRRLAAGFELRGRKTPLWPGLRLQL